MQVPGSSLGSSPEGLVAGGLESCVTRPVNDGLGFRTVSITPPKVILSTHVYRHPKYKAFLHTPNRQLADKCATNRQLIDKCATDLGKLAIRCTMYWKVGKSLHIYWQFGTW